MCGLAGVLYYDPLRPVDEPVLRAMGGALSHRGPDSEGIWREPGVGLVHRRLSIIDLEGGNQPIGNEDSSVQVVFNGEIYNFRQLRAGLEQKGHRFVTRSDTEVLVHLYEEEEDRLVERLRGMFAFALWDRKRGRLLLARDRVGIKPLYVYHDAEKLLFGSELKAILEYPGVRREIDLAALEDYMTFGMVPGSRSIFRHIVKLSPAHTLSVSRDCWHAVGRRYWDCRVEPDPRPALEEWQEIIRAKLTETVRAHLIADVGVGCFLSGGVDSSAIVALAAGSSPRGLHTFSIGFREESFSELPYARQVVARYSTQHVEQVVTPDAVSLLEELTRYYDEPFADSSAIPTFLVSRLASQTVKVVLSGDGGDEAFGGYARYAHDLKEAAVRRWLPRGMRRRVLGPLATIWPKADWAPRPLRVKTALTNLSLDAGAAYANTLALCRKALRRQLLAPDLAATLNGHEPERIVRDSYAKGAAYDPLGGMIAADMDMLLPDDFLVKVDRASMAHGLEVRPPMLDHELLELAARIPSRLKIRHGQTKWILKKSVDGLLPPATVWRPKHGFEVPIDGWIRGPLRETFADTVLHHRGKIGSLINLTTAKRLFNAHLAGTGRHGNVLWSLLVLAYWVRQYLTPASQPLLSIHALS